MVLMRAILGAPIEMTNRAGEYYDLGATYSTRRTFFGITLFILLRHTGIIAKVR
jgi:hypothetical protein